MASAMIQPPMDQPSIETKPATGPPRKRRRRTAAGGATDDCFTCRKRSVKCDRKRPYCTQCIEIGKECSGYKTTLTWGVGVASRGKLRGMTCPVSSGADDNTASAVVDVGARKRRKSSVSVAKKDSPDGNAPTDAAAAMSSSNALPISAPTPLTSQSLPTLPIPVPQRQPSPWQIPGFQEQLQSRRGQHERDGSLNLPPLQRIQTTQNSQYGSIGVPGSAMSSIGSYAETEYHSPLEYPHTPASLPFPDTLTNPFAEHSVTSSSTDSYSLHNTTSADSFAQSMDIGGSSDFADDGTVSPSHVELNPMDAMMFGGPMSFGNFDSFLQSNMEDLKEEEEDSLALFDTRFSNPFFHLTPRLQSLMEYYDRYVCPFLVTFDGPENPYRKHILQLAVNNEGLQNAIAALSTNNLRMRKKQTHQTGFIEELTEAFEGSNEGSNPNEASAEESMYKQMSIDQLNLQLSDTRAAADDSVLATLLILCLFHVCDSGFSKFKTQLAGVQKLLSLRNPTVQSNFTGWVEMFFTWFDVMTSTVNDREMQIKGESLDMLDYNANLGALEQFSGCDGRLFKLIARLGRLNLLAQGRPVRGNSNSDSTPKLSATKRPPFARMNSKKWAQAKRSLSPLDYENLDGNGWGSSIFGSDEADSSPEAAAEEVDDREEFWAEWRDIRSRLQAWQMDLSALPSPPADPAQYDAGHRDLVHINEVFRFSALLYTERLGNPVLPSSHPQFQALVTQALAHITAMPLTSCVHKFLLWPLFITGTECVQEEHRNIVRHRCIEIQKESGFYNNISGLEVLERVWREIGPGGVGQEEFEMNARRRDSNVRFSGRGGRYGQAFRWRKAMDRVDGEYIVI